MIRSLALASALALLGGCRETPEAPPAGAADVSAGGAAGAADGAILGPDHPLHVAAPEPAKPPQPPAPPKPAPAGIAPSPGVQVAAPPADPIPPAPAADADVAAAEELVAKAIAAAMDPDEGRGWRAFEALLHSDHKSDYGLRSWRAFNWPAFRRKVKLYLPDDSKVAFTIERVDRHDPERIKLFVRNEKSSPTPCGVRKDPAAKGAWRIDNCSL